MCTKRKIYYLHFCTPHICIFLVICTYSMFTLSYKKILQVYCLDSVSSGYSCYTCLHKYCMAYTIWHLVVIVRYYIALIIVFSGDTLERKRKLLLECLGLIFLPAFWTFSIFRTFFLKSGMLRARIKSADSVSTLHGRAGIEESLLQWRKRISF